LLAASCGNSKPPAPDRQEAVALIVLRNTIIKKVSLPEQRMEGRIAELERMARKAGIDESQLEFVWSKEGSAKVRSFEREAIERENMSLLDILRYSAGNTSMRFSARGNRVIIFHGAEPWPD
jgi:hypothetical protein